MTEERGLHQVGLAFAQGLLEEIREEAVLKAREAGVDQEFSLVIFL